MVLKGVLHCGTSHSTATWGKYMNNFENTKCRHPCRKNKLVLIKKVG